MVNDELHKCLIINQLQTIKTPFIFTQLLIKVETEGVKTISQYHNITITKWIEEKL